MFGELDEYSAGRRGVQKGNALSLSPDARLLIHQSQPGVAALLEHPIQVVYREADMVDSGAALFEEPADRGVRRVRLEKLNQRVPGYEPADPGAIAVGQVSLGHSEDIAIE